VAGKTENRDNDKKTNSLHQEYLLSVLKRDRNSVKRYHETIKL